jgi:glycosyltransferase involved in cell wall biosynthesis
VIVVIYFEYQNTKNNHAGMAYLFKKLSESNPRKIKLFRIPGYYGKFSIAINSFKKVFHYFLCIYLKIICRPGDTILLSEYLSAKASGEQHLLIDKLRLLSRLKIFALVHLPLSGLKKLHDDETIRTGLNKPDKIIVFGSKLKEELLGYCDKEKIVVTFHYVDTGYYRPGKKKPKAKLKAIVMGSLYRDKEMLNKIILKTPNIDYVIISGGEVINSEISDLPNVEVYGYLDEPELLSLMQCCDISLNVLFDTAGSNVITTSLACGLIVLVNNVGSVTDYCNKNNSFMCGTLSEYIEVLTYLENNKEKISEMSAESRSFSESISLNNSIQFFSTLDRL